MAGSSSLTVNAGAGVTARRLFLASHPAPTVAVTAFATVLAALAGVPAATCVLVAAAVASGQLTIGWSNDRIDAGRDALVGRRDKPIATGGLSPRTVDQAIAVALVATVVLSFCLGVRAGLANLVVVVCGWAYNFGLKATWFSWLPYAVAFGSLPAVATFALPHPSAPSAWLVAAGAGLGVVGNLTNALPDVADDERTGVRGAPHRLGARSCVVLASFLLLGTTALAVFGPARSPGPVGYTGLAIGVVLAAAGCGWALNHPRAKATFYGLFAFVALQLILLALTSDHLR